MQPIELRKKFPTSWSLSLRRFGRLAAGSMEFVFRALDKREKEARAAPHARELRAGLRSRAAGTATEDFCDVG